MALLLLILSLQDRETYARWSEFKAGSTVSFKTESLTGNKAVLEITYTLKDVSKEKVVLEGRGKKTVGGKESEIAAYTLNLFKHEASPQGPRPQKLKEGEEELDVAKKKLKCAWTEYSVPDITGPTKRTLKVWTSKDVPGWVVRQETRLDGELQSKSTVVDWKGK